ncbi:hypothetical protein ACS0TY_021116 [Phlomoides rotata]
MLKKHRIDFCCIQETKMESMKDSTCKSLWWDHCYDWACMDAEGRSGGILSIWNDGVFCKTSSWFTKGILVVNGFLRDNGNQVSVLNIYAPCSSSEKAILWDLIHNIILQLGNIYVAVVGDFNAIRAKNERVGMGL